MHHHCKCLLTSSSVPTHLSAQHKNAADASKSPQCSLSSTTRTTALLSSRLSVHSARTCQCYSGGSHWLPLAQNPISLNLAFYNWALSDKHSHFEMQETDAALQEAAEINRETALLSMEIGFTQHLSPSDTPSGGLPALQIQVSCAPPFCGHSEPSVKSRGGRGGQSSGGGPSGRGGA